MFIKIARKILVIHIIIYNVNIDIICVYQITFLLMIIKKIRHLLIIQYIQLLRKIYRVIFPLICKFLTRILIARAKRAIIISRLYEIQIANLTFLIIIFIVYETGI